MEQNNCPALTSVLTQKTISSDAVVVVLSYDVLRVLVIQQWITKQYSIYVRTGIGVHLLE